MGKAPPPILFADKNSCLRSSRCYGRRVAGYKRELSLNELRQIRRVKMRVVYVCAAVLLFVLTGVTGLIYLLYAASTR
jgi:hypothetical protein